ncbi:hypothetical protein QKU48_gp0276 [Fadolivirus algeromassiliense]|jgi:hypothetical protein|uniref:DUF5672 domain-containing protein n=1 Tax=Fadolivirus FV1/VV64 TaxID=3070911 RepID=A0A7D3UV69_9VIRU|nr:hypothetical protein QKU48_gp0276 [Fadolivirus algeromassiliense]QKF93734.1 hypothetical protein Fadolivirus_1_276 [Fadolivirus FV1/VV64]
MELIQSVHFNNINITNIFIQKINNHEDFCLNNHEFNINNTSINNYFTIKCVNGITRILNNGTQFNINIIFKLYIKTLHNCNFDNLDAMKQHYILYGNPNYDSKISMLKSLNIHKSLYDYLFDLDLFQQSYYPINTISETYMYLKDPKIEFRYFCFRYLDYIKSIKLPNITPSLNKETVIVEFRSFPHIEFLIRNMIIKIGSDWSHTVVCGNKNYDLIKNICCAISNNIKIIKLNIDNLNQSEYSKLLSTVEFWNNFIGDKILIYQEDSCIFNTNINDFLKYDYIGAPWPKEFNHPYNVGNGGFSLRSKSVMIKTINKISIYNTSFSPHTTNYIKHNKITTPPEDVYYSKNITEHHLGIVADWDTAHKFSMEILYYDNPLGGHNFWLSCKDWKCLLYRTILQQYSFNTNNNNISRLIQNLFKNDFLVDKNYTDNSIVSPFPNLNDNVAMFIN